MNHHFKSIHKISYLAVLMTIAMLSITFFNQNLLAKEPIRVKIASPAAAKQPAGIVLQRFADRVTKRSDGRLTLKIYPSNSLYGPRAAIEALLSGALEMAMISNGNLANFQKTLNFCDLPFLIESHEHLARVVQGPLTDRIKNQVEKESGVKLLYIQQAGAFRNLYTSTKLVKTPKDMKGIKLRTTASPVEQSLVKTYGGLPTFVDWGETYSALKQGVADGYFMLPNWLIYAKHNEVIKYGTLVNFYILMEPVMIAKNFYNSLPDDLKQILNEEAQKAAIESIETDKKTVTDSINHLRNDSGVQLYTPSDSEMTEWRKLGMKSWDDPKVREHVDWDLVKEIVKLKP